MYFKDFALTKECSALIKKQCLYRAFSFKINYCDVYSEANYKIGVAICRDLEINDMAHGARMVNMIVLNAATSITRLKSNRVEDLTEQDDLVQIETNSCSQNYDSVDLYRKLNAAIREKFKKSADVISVYETCILLGTKLEDASRELDIPINTVKTNMRRVRLFANSLRYSL